MKDVREAVYTRRQQKVIDAAEQAVTDAELELEDAEDAVRQAQAALKLAKRKLYQLHELGDML